MTHRQFIENNIPVFSLYNHDTHTCGCGDPTCKAIGKHPRATNWQSSPVWSDEQLDLMEETNQFATGYGVLCRDLIVIDVDARNGGVESYARLIKDHPEISACGLIVETGSGNGSKHLYFKAPQGIALMRHLPEYQGLDFQTGSSFVVGPGSLHASGNKYNIVHGSVDEIDEAPQSLITALTKPERHRTEYSGITMDVSHQDLADMVGVINPDIDHETWVRAGMAIHHASGGTAFHVWDEWSSRGSKYPDQETLEARWHSFGRSSMPVTIGTLIHYAEVNGWKRPVEFSTPVSPSPCTLEDQLDTSDIDLRRPPDMVGRIKAWIDANCAHPVESLSLGASLYVMGSLMGMRYTDDVTAVTTNMLVFNVAGSSVGKEAVLQSTLKLLSMANLSPATYSSIKSEQEITRNLIEHQPSFYVIDEFGGQFGKVINAQKRGGAAYLEGLPYKIMEVFSKAGGYYQLGGDGKAQVKADIAKEMASVNKRLDRGEEDPTKLEKKLEELQLAMKAVDEGIKNPFLCLMGFTTPETFEGLMDVGQATSGFLGRALLINELETNPRRKKNFKPQPMSEQLKGEIIALRYGGSFDCQEQRIECLDEKIIIPTTDEAKRFMDLAADWIYEHAELHKATTRLEAVVRRAFELMCKVSLLCAGSGVRDLAHVRYGFAIAKWDMNNKIRLVVSNDTTAKSDERLFASITRHVDKNHGITFGVLKNKLRSYREEDIKKSVDLLCANGTLRKEVYEHPVHKAEVMKFYSS